MEQNEQLPDSIQIYKKYMLKKAYTGVFKCKELSKRISNALAHIKNAIILENEHKASN